MNTGIQDRVGARLAAAVSEGERHTSPFQHWQLSDVFPREVVARMLALPVAPPAIDCAQGTRESNNSTRVFFDPTLRQQYAVCAEVAAGFQDPAVVAAMERRFGVALEGCFLRLEYAQDTEGFWLARHTDIRVKRVTLLVYLSPEPQAADFGTDLYDGNGTHVARVPFVSNVGLAFVPGNDTWHGFEKRPMPVVRRTLIMNYVTAAWRDRFELAYPEAPVSSARRSGEA